jgi:branched-chain amino acid transport system permease protein
MTIVVQQIFNALSLASMYALIALGITLVFGLTGLVNFAQGDLVMLGAMIALWATPKVGFVVGTLLACVAMAALSMALERGLFRRTRNSPLSGFMISLGLVLVLEGLAIAIWGNLTLQMPAPVPGRFVLGGVKIPAENLLTIAVAIPVLAIAFAFLYYTKVGTALRATAVDSEVAQWIGIPVTKLVMWTFVAGGVLAALAGALYAGLFPINAYIDSDLVIRGFAVAIIGGLGNPAGVLVAAVIVAALETGVSSTSLTAWLDPIVFGLIVMILLVRPTGLFRGAAGASLQQ